MYIIFTYTHRCVLLPLKAIFAYWCSWPMESTFETFGFSRVNCFESYRILEWFRILSNLIKHLLLPFFRGLLLLDLWAIPHKGEFPVEVILSLHGTKAPELHPPKICDFHFLTAISLVVVYIYIYISIFHHIRGTKSPNSLGKPEVTTKNYCDLLPIAGWGWPSGSGEQVGRVRSFNHHCESKKITPILILQI